MSEPCDEANDRGGRRLSSPLGCEGMMEVLSTLHRFFGTAKWRREQARRFAEQRFQSFDQPAAAIVLACIVEMLGVNFEQLHPETNLARDLGADEDEPQWIADCLRADFEISILPQQVAEAATVGGLVTLVSKLLYEKGGPTKR